jgi:DNA polymerase III subunit alpha
VLPPDVNESQVAFAPAREGTVVRFGLAAIKGVGEMAVENMLKARNSGGRFKSLSDLCERVDSRTVNRKVLEALIKSGACDTFGHTRASLFAQIERTLASAVSVVQDRMSGQGSLFDALDKKDTGTRSAAPELPEWPTSELLAAEKELLGFYVTGHPINPYLPLIEKYALTTIAGLATLENRSLTRVGGIVASVQQGISKKSNKPYLLATLEDQEGTVQLLCLNENYEKFRNLLVVGNALLIVGEINLGDDKPKVFPQEIMLLDDAPGRLTRQVHLRLDTGQLTGNHLETARELVRAHAGKCPLFLCLMRPTGEIVFIETNEKFWVTPSRKLQQSVEETFGKEAYYAKADTSLPERAVRKWAKKNGDAGEG